MPQNALPQRFSESGWSRRTKKSFSLVFWGSTGRMASSKGGILGRLHTTLPSYLHQNRHHSRHIQKNYPVEPGLRQIRKGIKET